MFRVGKYFLCIYIIKPNTHVKLYVQPSYAGGDVTGGYSRLSYLITQVTVTGEHNLMKK